MTDNILNDTPPQPPAKKRRRWPWIVGIIAALFVGVSLASSGGDDPEATSNSGGDSGGSNATIGEPAKDGDFTFTVTKVKNGPKMIGNEAFGAEPQGKFVSVHLTVENHGNEPGSFFGDNQYLIDGEGREHSADTEAAIYLDESKSLYEEINPGNKLSGIVVFDIPKDAKPVELKLHDSAFSGGVTVTVAK